MKKKNNLKKLALLGITGGLVFTAQGIQAEENNPLENGTYLAGGCGAGKCKSIAGCGGSSGGGNGCGAHHSADDQGYRGSHHGCGGSTEQSSKTQSDNNTQGYYNPNQNQTPQANSQDQNHSHDNYQGYNNQRGNNQVAEADESVVNNQKHLNEKELESQLNPETKALFQKMTPDEKKFALKVANQSCKGKNDCKGLNACKTENNSCAGLGSCKGTSPGPFSDKNKAVKVAAQKLTEKRKNLNK